MNRNISIERWYERIGQTHVPRYRFRGSNASDFQKWKSELIPQLTESLGKLPKKVPLNPEITAEWRGDGLIKRRVLIDVEEDLAVPALIFRPEKSTGKLPAIFCCHGHGEWGKGPMMGDKNPAQQARIAQRHHDFGLKMAQQGFVTMAIDWRGFGERDDRRKPHYHDVTHGRDLCDINYVRASILGMTMLGLNIHDARCAIDHLASLDFVDANRIGTMGFSLGGTITTWLAMLDDRIKAADIINYSDRFAEMGLRTANFCGSQITPALFDLCDIPDLHGLIAPKPLLVEIGAWDECFEIEPAMSCWREVEKIYSAAGARDRLELDLVDAGHTWGGVKSIGFFKKNL